MTQAIPHVSVNYACNGSSKKTNELGMRAMQELLRIADLVDDESKRDKVTAALKAIAASLLMEQVLAPRFNFMPKNQQSGPVEGYDYGEKGYDPEKNNVGFNQETGQFQIEIKGLIEPKSEVAGVFVMRI